MTPFVSAEGTTWLLVFCLKIPRRKDDTPLSVYIPKEEKGWRSQNSPLGTLILGSSSGLLDSKLWEIALLKFIEIVRTCSLYPACKIVLILDNLGIHRQPCTIEKALKDSCYLVYLPPNTSHFTQPLDIILFSASST